MAVYPYFDSLVTRSKQSVKLLEMMAAGCPVVATNTGDIARTLGRAGMILQDDDPKSFAVAVRDVLRNKDDALFMSNHGQERVSRDFTFDILGQKLLDLYRSAGIQVP